VLEAPRSDTIVRLLVALTAHLTSYDNSYPRPNFVCPELKPLFTAVLERGIMERDAHRYDL